MKACTKYVGLIATIALSACLSDSAFAQTIRGQNFSGSGGKSNTKSETDSRSKSNSNSSSRSGASGFAGGNSSTSRSVSFKKNGKRIAITENSRGITISVDGRSVRAKDIPELKQKYPNEYRLYEEYLSNPKIRIYSGGGGSANAGGSAGARGTANGRGMSSGGGMANGSGGPGNFNQDSTMNRNVTTVDNGKKISITQNKAGITVSINGKRVRAKNPAELKKKSSDAYEMYQKHMGKSFMGGANSRTGHPDANTLMQQQLRKMLDDNADNPQVRDMIQRMIENTREL